MSRRNVINTQLIELCELIDNYKKDKDIQNSYKKSIDGMNEKIKDIMKSNNLDKFDTSMYTATLSTTVKEELNEDKAIEILKENLSAEDLEKVIVVKEEIDDLALEDLVFKNKFDINKLECCKTQKDPTYTLRIAKLKK